MLDIFSRRKIKTEEDVAESKSFCMLPWVHLYLNTQGKVTPCCLSPWSEDSHLGDINKNSIDQIWNDKPIRKLRTTMLKDRKVEGCWQCYQHEEHGLRSKRIMSNELYKHKFDWVKSTDRTGRSADSKPVYWDIRISNLCNFKCRICGHHSSSKLYDEAKELGTTCFPERVHYSVSDMPDFYKQIIPLMDSVEEVYFAGGEPLIMPEHYRIIDLLLEHGRTDVKLRYATNFSEMMFKGRDVMEIWDRFDNVFIHASLDGSGARGEYQRKGQSWDKVLVNRQRILSDHPKIDFMITPTISVFNVQHLPEFHKEWVENGLIKVDDMIPHLLKQPEIYDIRILPKEIKEKVASIYRQHLIWLDTFDDQEFFKLPMVRNEFSQCLEYLWSADCSELIPEFKKHCDQLDRMRKETTLEVFPELESILI